MADLAEKEVEGRTLSTEKLSVQEAFEKRTSSVVEVVNGLEVNASGHSDELQRHFSIWSLCGLALTIDSAWVAAGGSIAVAVANGGPPGVLYEFLGVFISRVLATSIAPIRILGITESIRGLHQVLAPGKSTIVLSPATTSYYCVHAPQ